MLLLLLNKFKFFEEKTFAVINLLELHGVTDFKYNIRGISFLIFVKFLA